MPVRDAIVAVTHRCNARCVMCRIWQCEGVDRLAPEHLRKLPPSLRTVNLTGGEPFLRDDLPAFLRAVRRACPRAITTISTNALLVERIEDMIADLLSVDPRVRLAVSLDGMGQAHDRIRGVEGAFAKAMTLIDTLRGRGYGGLRLGMTLTEQNLAELPGVAELADRLGLELGLVAAHEATTHLGVAEGELQPAAAPDPEPMRRVIERWLCSTRPKLWLRAHFAEFTWRFMTGSLPKLPCGAGREFFFCQADGEVYACSVCGRRMGNLAEQSWAELWRGSEAGEARRAAAGCPRTCWMICTARSVYRRRRFATLGWLVRAKPAAHLGRYRLAGDMERTGGARPAD